MFQSILLAVDRSSSSRVATTYANYLATELDAVLNVLHVADARQEELHCYRTEGSSAALMAETALRAHEGRAAKQRNDELLNQVRARAAACGVSCHTRLLSGVPSREILAAAEDNDLVVLGRHGESRQVDSRKHLGEVVESLLRFATQPVLLAGVEFGNFRRVLLGFDGGRAARGAMLCAMTLARRLALPVMAVSVHARHVQARHQLDVVERYAAAHDQQVSTCTGTGDPVRALLDIAQEDDLLAIGSFGEGRLHEWLLGSTTAAVLRSAPQAILLHR